MEISKSHFELILDENLQFCTHVNGMKCNVSIDKPGGSVYVTGIGHKQCRNITFVKAARAILRRFMNVSESEDVSARFRSENVKYTSILVTASEKVSDSISVTSTPQR